MVMEVKVKYLDGKVIEYIREPFIDLDYLGVIDFHSQEILLGLVEVFVLESHNNALNAVRLLDTRGYKWKEINLAEYVSVRSEAI